MGKFSKKILSLILCFVTVFVLTVTAFAEDTAVGFFDFTNSVYQTWKVENPDADDSMFTGFGGGRSDFASGFGGGRDGYDAYVASLPAVTVSGNAFYFGNIPVNPLGYKPEIVNGYYTLRSTDVLSTASYVHVYNGTDRGLPDIKFPIPTIFCQVSYDATYLLIQNGSYRLVYEKYSDIGDGCSYANRSVVSVYSYFFYYYDTATNTISIYSVPRVFYGDASYIGHLKKVTYFFYSCDASSDYTFPTTPTVDYSLVVDSSTRAGSITGGYASVSGGVYPNCTVFNETTNTFTDPATGITTAISSWTYDYTTCTYSLYDTDGNLISVAYQDQQLAITSGETVTNYNYYVAGSGGDHCNHEYVSSVTTESTCTVPGVLTYTCLLCNQSYVEAIPAAGHVWVVDHEVEPEYDAGGVLIQDGYTVYKCSKCGEEYQSSDGSPPPGDESGFWAWWQKAWNAFTARLFELLGKGSGAAAGSIEELPAGSGDFVFTDNVNSDNVTVPDAVGGAASGLWAFVKGVYGFASDAFGNLGKAMGRITSFGDVGSPGGAFGFFLLESLM